MLLIALSKIDTLMCLYIENYQALGVVKNSVSDLNSSKVIPIITYLALFMKVITDNFWLEFETQIVIDLKARRYVLLYMYNDRMIFI